MKERISGFDGSVITEPSYNVIRVPMQQWSGDLWKAKVAMTGSGACKWTLSAVTLGIEYIEATHLGKDLVLGTAVGVSLAFDNDASRNGQYTATEGDINLSPKYYPYISEWKLIENKKELSLLGKASFVTLNTHNLNKIKFSLVIDESKLVKYIGIEKKVEGVYSKIECPDGSIVSDGTVFPDFDRLDNMKVNK